MSSRTAVSRQVALVPAVHVHDLIAENRELRESLKSANASRDNLFKQLNYAVSAAKIVDTLLVGGALTVVTSTGKVQQLQTEAIVSPTEAGYRARWVDLTPVPGTAAALLSAATHDGALAGGMACVDGEEDEPA
jgi:hypothetical protein